MSITRSAGPQPTPEEWQALKQEALDMSAHPFRQVVLQLGWPSPAELVSYPFFDEEGLAVVNARMTPGVAGTMTSVPWHCVVEVVPQ